MEVARPTGDPRDTPKAVRGYLGPLTAPRNSVRVLSLLGVNGTHSTACCPTQRSKVSCFEDDDRDTALGCHVRSTRGSNVIGRDAPTTVLLRTSRLLEVCAEACVAKQKKLARFGAT